MKRVRVLPVRNDHHQKTTVAPAIIAGVGVHTGDRVRLAVRPAPQPEQRREDPAYDDHDDRDHRKSGWSLFGRGKRQQPAQPTYAPQTRTTEMRSTSQVQPTPEPDQGQAEDDMEIPSFLRRLAN